MEGPKVTEEIRRSDGDPTRSKILEYLPEIESRLSITAGDTKRHVKGSAIDGRQHRPVTCKSRQGSEREEGVDDVERREASFTTSAMLESAISDRCIVT